MFTIQGINSDYWKYTYFKNNLDIKRYNSHYIKATY